MDCGHVVAVQSATLPSKLLEEAVVLCRQLTEAECPLIHHTQLAEHLINSKVDLFILPYFSGPEYEKLREARKPVIGPAALLYLLNNETLLPRRLQTQPLYSLCLHGAQICCSNIAKEARDELYNLVRSMGGSVSPALTNAVSHLVVEEVGSKKYQFAVKYSIPIMSPEWITNLWELSKTSNVKNDKAVVEQFKCPPFRGCTICVSGLDMAKRTEVEHLATKYGGSYSGDLVMEKCTHLLIENPEGQKFSFAQKWKIPCVKLKWFYDSIEKGLCQDIQDYEHDPVPHKENVSEASYLVKPLLEETRDINITLNNANLTLLDVTVNKDKQYLEGCKIYLDGFPQPEQDQLKKIINNGGGTRLDTLTNRVTHVIAKSRTLKELQALSERQPDAHILSVQWLTESMEKGAHQEESTFDMLPTENVTTDNPFPTLGAAFGKVKLEPVAEVKLEFNTDDILMQYSQNTPAPEASVTEYERPARNTRVQSKHKTNSTRSSSNDTTNAVDKTANQTITSKRSSLFNGLSFHVSPNISAKVGKNVKNQILLNSGQLRDCERDVSDYCIVDTFSQTPKVCKIKDKAIRSYMWVQRCIETETLLAPDLCPLYTPRAIPKSCGVLKDKVISTTQFSGYELAHIEQCIKAMGGIMQGTFSYKKVMSSKKRPDSLPCTHLLHKDKAGTKHEAALKWRIPSVTVEWLYHCYTSLELVDTAPYEDTEALEAAQAAHVVKAATHLKDAGVTLTNSGTILKNDHDGFVTPMKLNNKRLKGLKIDDVMDALASPACTADNNKSIDMEALYKKNISEALKRTTPPARILSGVVVAVKGTAKAYADCDIANVKVTARRLGAMLRTNLDKTCTHVICARDTKDAALELAVKSGVHIVSYHWVLACEEHGHKLPESEYQPGFDPKRSLSISISEETTVPSIDIDNTTLQTSHSTSHNSTSHNNTAAAAENCSLDPELQEQIAMLAEIEKERESGAFAEPGSTVGTPRSRSMKRSTARKIAPLNVPMEDLLSQQPMSVTYEDGKEAREALLAKENVILAKRRASKEKSFSDLTMPHGSLHPNSSSTPNATVDKRESGVKCTEAQNEDVLAGLNEEDFDDTGITDIELDLEEVIEVVSAPRTPPQVLLSGMSTKEKQDTIDIISKMGGRVIHSAGFDVACTHLICGKPSRNEKYLAALAAGTWIMHPSWVTQSTEEGGWLDEASFTWDKFTDSLRGSEMSLRLARAGLAWRKRKAFNGWRIILCTDPNKVANFSNIIEAGGGAVLQSKPPFTVQSGITHAFCDFDSKTVKLSVTRGEKNYVPIAALYESGVLCVKPEYIAEFLICVETPPDTDKFLVEPVKDIMTKKRARESSFNEPGSFKRMKTEELKG